MQSLALLSIVPFATLALAVVVKGYDSIPHATIAKFSTRFSR